MLIVDEQKMSKSLGNTYTIPQVIERGPAVGGRYPLSARLRKQLNFVGQPGRAEEALRRLTDFLARSTRCRSLVSIRRLRRSRHCPAEFRGDAGRTPRLRWARSSSWCAR